MVNYDELGPEKVLLVYDPKTKMKGFTVIDNTNLGPAKGGIRMTPSVTVEEVSKLARAMTLKNALAEIPFGGGKSGIVADNSKLTKENKDKLITAFGKALKEVCPSRYVAAPDMYMGEHEMKVFAKAVGHIDACTGKPKDICEGYKCGIPHELGSTGYGVARSAKVAVEHTGLDMKKITFGIEGFGNVGSFAAKFLLEMGAKFVAASDSKGALYNEKGISYDDAVGVKKEGRCIVHCDKTKEIPKEKFFEMDMDLMITASVPDVIHEENYKKVKAKIIVQGSNIPMTYDVEEKLFEKGVIIVPDIIANAGGVISSYMEYAGMDVKELFPTIERKIEPNTRLVLERSKENKVSARKAALAIAEERVKNAKRFM
ncbi:Glu/Leu/Phe/Val dehydrogenase [Thermoproteota archaeon]